MEICTENCSGIYDEGLPHSPAMVLLGPTGSGKTPLGETLAARGLLGRPVYHFDFGHQLRRAATGQASADFTQEELAFLRRVLATAALLEDEQLPLALKILRSFLKEASIRPGDWLVLNGLPRHVGQAEGISPLMQVTLVVELVCPPEVVLERIRSNVGGDRVGRSDDTPEMVRQKLLTYETRTRPLVEYYQRRNIPVVRVEVGSQTSPQDLVHTLEKSLSTSPVPSTGSLASYGFGGLKGTA